MAAITQRAMGLVKMLKRIIGFLGVCLVCCCPPMVGQRMVAIIGAVSVPKRKRMFSATINAGKIFRRKTKSTSAKSGIGFKNLPPDQRDNLRRRYDELRKQRPRDKR